MPRPRLDIEELDQIRQNRTVEIPKTEQPPTIKQPEEKPLLVGTILDEPIPDPPKPKKPYVDKDLSINTTVRITEATRKRLCRFGEKAETYDEVINRVLDERISAPDVLDKVTEADVLKAKREDKLRVWPHIEPIVDWEQIRKKVRKQGNIPAEVQDENNPIPQ